MAQCRRFGVEILSAAEVTRVTSDGQDRAIGLANGDGIRAQAVLLAPGATYRRLAMAGEEDFIGAGVYFCATCDGPFYRDLESAARSGAHGTPTFFINGVKHEGADTFEDLMGEIREQFPDEQATLDVVDEASEEAFPASDPLSWIGEPPRCAPFA